MIKTIKTVSIKKKLTSFFLILALCLACPVSAENLSPVVTDVSTPIQLKLMTGKSLVLSIDRPIKRVSLANPEIADVLVISPNQIYLRGKKPGLTNLSLWGGKEKLVTIYELEISLDISQLKGRLHELFPEENIRVTTSYNTVFQVGDKKIKAVYGTIILSGEVSSSATLSQIMSLAESYTEGKVVNLLHVSGVHQVMLEVRISEISRSVLRELGFNFECIWGDGATSAAGDLFSIATPPLMADLLFARGKTTWTALIKALKDNGLARMLAEPTLITLSGQEASFLAGGEIPIPVQTETGISVEYKEYGIGVTFSPTVLSSKKISMRVAPEVSELDYENAICIAGAMVPGLTTRQASTMIELGDGQSFAIAGLIRETNRNTISKVPLLGDIPILGALFRSSEFKKNESELVIIVTVHLVKPLNMAAQTLPTDMYIDPSDFEFFLLGALEGRDDHSPAGRVSPLRKEGGLDGEFGHIVPRWSKVNDEIENK